jgi:tetratricopeptide (TPR) repeat protein
MLKANLADARGLSVVASNPDTVRGLDAAVDAYLGARSDARDRLDVVLADDPSCVLAHCLDGYLNLLSSKRAGFTRAEAALDNATRAAGRLSALAPRERSHVAALDAWCHGDLRGAVRHWDAVLDHSPLDVIALRVSQFVLSYLGESARMRVTIERALPSWGPQVPGYGYVLGCHAYALEESGDYAHAESTGRRAVEINPSDIWAAHAVAHVAEMQGRLGDGLTWIRDVAPHWTLCNNFTLHLRWHEALYHLDLDRTSTVLALYDAVVRRVATDEYLDVANAVSLLWRLEQAGVDAGERWRELADCARGHLHEHTLVFVDLHYLMALAAVDDTQAVGEFMESCERFARLGGDTEAAVMTDIGLPLARGIVAHRRGDYGEVVDVLAPVRDRIKRVGGSHAQRDLFDLMLIDAAVRARRLTIADELLAERTTKRPRNIWGWSQYAKVLDALGASGASAAAHRADALRAS